MAKKCRTCAHMIKEISGQRECHRRLRQKIPINMARQSGFPCGVRGKLYYSIISAQKERKAYDAWAARMAI